MTPITVVYAPQDKVVAEQIANDIEQAGYTFGSITANSTVVGVITADGITHDDLLTTLQQSLEAGARVILLKLAPVSLPDWLSDTIQIEAYAGYRFKQLQAALGAPRTLASRNRRWGIGLGIGLIILFGIYTWAIVVFDIEAPVEEFQRAYTHSAATVGAFAQPFVPRTTEEAENFETTLESRLISDELATVIVQTATRAGEIGGYTPVPTGLIIAPAELSVVRQTATGGAILRATETAAASNAEFESIAATATQAAIDAEALLTATPAAGS